MLNCTRILAACVVLGIPAASQAWAEPDASPAEAVLPRLDEQLPIDRRSLQPQPTTFAIPGANVWGRGLTEPSGSLMAPVPELLAPLPDKTLGAKLRPFKDLDLQIGTAMTRDRNDHDLRSEVNWQFSWSRQWDRFAGLKLDVSTTGSLDPAQMGLPGALAGSLRVPVWQPQDGWKTQLSLSPRMTFDNGSSDWKPAVTPELVSEKALNARSSPVKSTLSLKVGSAWTPDAPPSASAKVEFKIAPK